MTEHEKNESHGPESTGSAPSLPVKTPQASRPKMLPPWKVLLHNDDVNVMEDVVQTLQKLMPLSKEDAVARTLEAHKQGVSLLLVTHRERAELYVEQFTSCKLTVTAEPDA